MVLTASLAASAEAQSVVHHLHAEASATSGFKQLKAAGPDAAQSILQTAALQSVAVGEKQTAQFNTVAGAPNTPGKIPTGATVSAVVWMRKTANLGTMFPRIKVRLNSSTGTSFCTATGTTALTTTLAAYTVSCVTTATITMTASDRLYVWAGVNLTVASSAGAFRGELGLEGTLNGAADSRVDIPAASPAPSISALSPNAGAIGQAVTISGNNFRDQQLGSTVRFFNNRTATVTSWSNTSIAVTVPASSVTGNVTVTVAATDSTGVPFTVGAVPVVTLLSPAQGVSGTSVTIAGTNFGSTKGTSTVTFNGATATTTSWSATSITASVPSGATTGNVVVTRSGMSSAGVLFTVPTLTSIAVTPANLTVPLKSRQRFKATGTYSGGSVQDVTATVTWSSLQPAVAQVDAAGVTTAVGKGTSSLQATLGAITGSTTFAVTSPSFARVGMMNTSRDGHTATLLPDGKVLIAGGQTMSSSGATVLTTAELYDPVTGEFTTPDSMSVPRIHHTATALPNGMVLILGGLRYTPTYQSLRSAELYDPAAGSFTPLGSMWSGHYFHTATLLDDGKVLVVGGRYLMDFDGGNAPNEIYDPSTSTFTLTGDMATGRFSHAASRLLDGTVLISGGSDGDVTVATAERYQPETGTFVPTGSMLNARGSHNTAVLPNGTVLIVGGLDACVLTCPAEIYSPAAGLFALTYEVNTKAGESVEVLADGSVLVVGGQDNTLNLAIAEVFDPVTQSFTAAGAMQKPRVSAVATTLGDGTVLVTGGTGTVPSAEVYSSSGSPAQAITLRISPANPNIVVGQTAQFVVVDSIGRMRDDAQWTLGGPGATLQTDPTVVLTADTPGVVTLSATVGGVTTQTEVTIVSESAVVAGQPLWTAANATSLPVKQIVQATPTVDGPNLYVISGDAIRTFVQALALDGRQLWQASVPVAANKNSAPDGLGGLIMTFHNTCDNVHPMKIVAFDGATGDWRWEVESGSKCTFEAPQFAIRQDLAVVVASPGNTSGLPGLMVLDGATGQTVLTPAIPQSTVTSFSGSVTQGYSRIGAPMVDSDGTILIQYEQRHVAYPPRVDQSGIWLLKVAPDGTSTTTQLANVTTDTNLFPGRVIPDGAGGAIATWTFSPSDGSVDPDPLRAAHLSVGGSVTEFALPIQPSQLLKENSIPISSSLALGESGTAFATYGSRIASFNFSGGAQWTAQPAATTIEIIATDDQNGVVAKVTDGGGADTLVTFSATGAQTASTLPPMGGQVEQVSGEFWTGVDNGELRVYANIPVLSSSVWSSWNQRRTNQALTRASIAVKCRPITSNPTDPWWQKIAFRIALHCYIVTREQNGTVSTIEGGELNSQPTGILGVWKTAGDSVKANRPTDTAYWWSPALPWLDDADAQTRIPCLQAKVPQIHAAQLAYHYRGPNSNRAVVELTEACGISTVWLFMPPNAPGFLTPFAPPWY